MSKHNRTITDQEIESYMQNVVAEHTDPRTGQVNCTFLAEDTAHHFGHDEWLDDELHPIWFISVDVAEVHEQAVSAFAGR